MCDVGKPRLRTGTHLQEIAFPAYIYRVRKHRDAHGIGLHSYTALRLGERIVGTYRVMIRGDEILIDDTYPCRVISEFEAKLLLLKT